MAWTDTFRSRPLVSLGLVLSLVAAILTIGQFAGLFVIVDLEPHILRAPGPITFDFQRDFDPGESLEKYSLQIKPVRHEQWRYDAKFGNWADYGFSDGDLWCRSMAYQRDMCNEWTSPAVGGCSCFGCSICGTYDAIPPENPSITCGSDTVWSHTGIWSVPEPINFADVINKAAGSDFQCQYKTSNGVGGIEFDFSGFEQQSTFGPTPQPEPEITIPPQENTPRCDDGIKNGDELGQDCGGSCIAQCEATNPATQAGKTVIDYVVDNAVFVLAAVLLLIGGIIVAVRKRH